MGHQDWLNQEDLEFQRVNLYGGSNGLETTHEATPRPRDSGHTLHCDAGLAIDEQAWTSPERVRPRLL